MKGSFDRAMKSLGIPPPFAVAVSGGSDSIALMHLLAALSRDRDAPPPHVLTVDHGLRAGSTREAQSVVKQAKALGLSATVLTWRGAKPKSNIEGLAREARYRLMGTWCRAHGVAALFVAHTEDDQTETFLLRLARGSGVDGLSAMRPRAPYPLKGFEGTELLRPLLEFTRAELRAYLTARGAGWIDDPMNDEPRFARTRLRKLWPELEAAGLTPKRIAAATRHLGRAREALESATHAFIAAHARASDGSVHLDGAALAKAPREIGLRVLAALLLRVGGGTYRPRFERLESLYDAMTAPRAVARTLAGCRIGPAPKRDQQYGERTLAIAPEKAGKPRALARKTAKQPQNRRNPALVCV